jgi:hypothetical protein
VYIIRGRGIVDKGVGGTYKGNGSSKKGGIKKVNIDIFISKGV